MCEIAETVALVQVFLVHDQCNLLMCYLSIASNSSRSLLFLLLLQRTQLKYPGIFILGYYAGISTEMSKDFLNLI
jgi:hypothetical protein